jgi:hypothetical protein
MIYVESRTLTEMWYLGAVSQLQARMVCCSTVMPYIGDVDDTVLGDDC